jgi:23S rRNA (cytosine1962-C5)-methyltransferase
MKTVRCILQSGKERPVKNRHPWIFSGAIDSIDEGFEAGDLVRVFSGHDEFLGIGYLNPASQIVVRMLAFEDVAIDEAFFDEKIARAIAMRKKFFANCRHCEEPRRGDAAISSDKSRIASPPARNDSMPPATNAYRLIHSEGDFLSGLTVDVYGDFLVAEFNTAGIDAWKPVIVAILQKYFPGASIFERSDSDLRKWEGLKRSVGVLTGKEPPEAIEILENGLRFGVDIKGGQKTGFFLDQRESREVVRGLAAGKRVLNCFAYTGGFSVYAASGGAKEVVSVESSEPAVEMGRKNFERNGFLQGASNASVILRPDVPPVAGRESGRRISTEMLPSDLVPPTAGKESQNGMLRSAQHDGIYEGSKCRFVWAQTDVFDYLRTTKKEFDLIILDPPAFCKSKNQVRDAARGYKDINLQALRQLPKGGLLFTFSCSSYITPDLFQKILFGAAADAGRDVRILKKTSHAFDHPINIYHPEGEYLKGLLCEVS